MKNEKGITLQALVLYVIMFSVTIALLASLSSYIFGNLDNISEAQASSEEFNKFNINIIEDVKSSKVAQANQDSSGNVIIALENGATYTYKADEKSIYKGKVKIARNIVEFSAKSGVENNKNIIEVTVSTGKNASNIVFSKTIKYVLKYW